jgi:hypothetical protein
METNEAVIDLAAGAQRGASGRFDFTHPALTRTDLKFVRDDDRRPTLTFDLGDVRAAVPLSQVAANYGIPDRPPDLDLLNKIEAALRFSRAIVPGDPIPSETVDATPSWTPRPHYLCRAALKLGRALGATPSAGCDDPAAMLRDLERAVRANAVGSAPDAAAMAELTRDVARVEWLCRAVVSAQRVLGGLAKAGAERGMRSVSDTTRAGAVALRAPALWASDLAMRADALAADLRAACRAVPAFRRRLNPIVASLRVFALDIEPLVEMWNAENARMGGPSALGLEKIATMAIRRYGKFNPADFEWTPPAARAARHAFDA